MTVLTLLSVLTPSTVTSEVENVAPALPVLFLLNAASWSPTAVVNQVNELVPSRVFATHTPGMMSGFRADPVTLELISIHTGCFLLYTLKSPLPASGLAPVPSDFYIFIWNVLMGTTETFLFPPIRKFLPLYSVFVCAFIKTVVYLVPK